MVTGQSMKTWSGIMKLKIAYLPSDCAAELPLPPNFTDEQRTTAILAHPELEYHSLDEFIEAFNSGYISDQGYMAVVHRVESEHLDRVWTKGLPTEPGQYWFYGYRYGVISVGHVCEPELILIDVRKIQNGVMVVGNGQFVAKSEVEHAWHTPFNILELDPLPISPEQHEINVKKAAN